MVLTSCTNVNMTITAKFSSVCPSCGGAISPGQQVEWEKGQKARHTDCSTAAAAPASPAAPAAPRAITVERVGRRSYFRGDTLSVRNLLRSGGAHWDGDRKAWWIGSHDAALALATSAATAPAEAPPPKPRCCSVCGAREEFDSRGYARVRIYRSGECSDCFEERKMGY